MSKNFRLHLVANNCPGNAVASTLSVICNGIPYLNVAAPFTQKKPTLFSLMWSKDIRENAIKGELLITRVTFQENAPAIHIVNNKFNERFTFDQQAFTD